MNSLNHFVRVKCFFLVLILLINGVALANNAFPERAIWEKVPIRLHIQTGHERIIHFPGEIRFWLPDHLKNKVTALAANGVLYLQAHESFVITRIRVQDLSTQQVFLLDVVANDDKSISDELFVILPDDSTKLPTTSNDSLTET